MFGTYRYVYMIHIHARVCFENPGDTLASVTLNRNMYENVLRELLLEGAEHCVELWEGAGASWKVTK